MSYIQIFIGYYPYAHYFYVLGNKSEKSKQVPDIPDKYPMLNIEQQQLAAWTSELPIQD